MLSILYDVVVASAEHAFLEVTVFVGFALLIFGYINYLTQGRFIALLEQNRGMQPVFGAILGLTPGCGGAIFVMPLYINGSVTFGTVVAALVATMGDSAFVLLAALPLHFVVVSAISVIVAIIAGYAVDGLHLAAVLNLRPQKSAAEEAHPSHEDHHDHAIQEMVCNTITGCGDRHLRHIGHSEGDTVDFALHHDHPSLIHPGHLLSRLVTTGSLVYWWIIAAGAVFGVLLLFQVDLAATAAGRIARSAGRPGRPQTAMERRAARGGAGRDGRAARPVPPPAACGPGVRQRVGRPGPEVVVPLRPPPDDPDAAGPAGTN